MDAPTARTITDAAPVMVFVADRDGYITFAEGGLLAAMGLRSDDVVGEHLDTLQPESPDVTERLQRALAGEESRIVARSGRWVLDVWYRPSRDPEGRVVGVLGMACEVDQAQRTLALHSLHSTVLQRVLHGVSREERLHAITALVEGSADDLRCQVRIPDPLLPLDDPATAVTMPVRNAGGDVVGAVVGSAPGGRALSAHERSLLELGAALAGVVIDRDHDRQRQRDATLRDPLTGLLSRTQLLDTLGGMIQAAAAPALLFCNLDRFRLINDSLGPDVGDRVLAAVAARLRSTVHPHDVVARVGADEFVVLLAGGRDDAEVEQIARRVLARVTAPMDIAGRHLLSTISVGVALPHPDDSAAELLSRANLAMSQAKRRGGERYMLGRRTAGDDSALRRLELETGIRAALHRDELRLHFQPIVRCDTGQVALVEALVRWQHPQRGMMAPEAFLSGAKDAGVLGAIDRWVLHEACRLVASARTIGTATPVVSVNFAGLPYDDAQLVPCVLASIVDAGLRPEQVIIEVTEEMLAAEASGAVAAFERLRTHGVRIAIDDFGTGYSSLHRLRSLPVDLLKVDRSFVADLGCQADATALLAAIVTMGHALGMEVVAEGVETAEQLAELRRLGCDMAQGYHFARPAPLTALAGGAAGNGHADALTWRAGRNGPGAARV